MTRPSRRSQVAAWAGRLGVTRLLGALPQRRRLVALNYHRIGDATRAAYDADVYSATREDFATQVAYLKAHADILTLPEAVDWLDRPDGRRGAAVLITFDDGYLDNYTDAFPVLRDHGVSGTFFLPTAFIGTHRLPWWDLIAHYVRQTAATRIAIDYPAVHAWELGGGAARQLIARALQKLYKSPAMTDPERFLGELGAACGITAPLSPVRTFLDWTEAAEMVAGGMCIGSHTHSHELLAKLSLDEQIAELSRSREILESKLAITVDVAAYPVGSKTAFSTTTFAALEHCGYRAAFSYYGGVNRPGHTERFDIQRIAVDSDVDLSLFRLRGALALATGQELI